MHAVHLEHWIGLLKQWRQSKDFHQTRLLLHVLVSEQKNLSLCNFVIPTLVECGHLQDAHHLLHRVVPPAHQTQHSWNSFIMACVRHEDPSHAFSLFDTMHQAVPPDRITFLALLDACRHPHDSTQGLILHAYIICLGLENEGFTDGAALGNSLVGMYGRCSLLADAHHVFDHLPFQNVISWNSLIAVYTKYGMCIEAGGCFQKMLMQGISPIPATFICILKACGVAQNADLGQTLHSEISKRGLEREIQLASTVMDMYNDCGLLKDSQAVFAGLPAQDVILWSSLIRSHAVHGLSKEAWNCMQNMILEGIAPDSITYVCILKACSTIEALEIGQEIHAQATKCGVERELCVCSALIDMYAKCGLLAEAQQMFDELPVRDRVLWSTLITGYTDHEMGQEGLSYFKQALEDGVAPDNIMLVCGLKACSCIGALDVGQVLHCECVKRGLERDVCVNSVLVNMYAECGLIVEACHVFDGLPSHTVVTWNAIIVGHVVDGKGEEAWACYCRMLQEGLAPDAVTFIGTLQASASMVGLERGQKLHMEAIKRGLELEPRLECILVDMYTKCGALVDALNMLERVQIPDAFSWTSLMGGFAAHGLANEAAQSFEKALHDGVSINSTMVIYILKACAMAGFLKTGWKVHCEIAKRGLDRELGIGNAIVECYIGCASLSDARQMFDLLSVQDSVAWSLLVAGYSQYGMGEKAMQLLKQMPCDKLLVDASSFISRIKACGGIQAVDMGHKLHTETVKRGMESEIDMGNVLVAMYAECASLWEACQVLDHLPHCNIVSYNTLIVAYTEFEMIKETQECFQQMLCKNVCPDSTSFMCMLKACGAKGDEQMCHTVHTEITKMGLEGELHMGSAVINLYIGFGLINEACQVHNMLVVKDAVSWNALIAGYVGLGMNDEADKCYEQLKKESIPSDLVTFLCRLKACAAVGTLESGWEVHAEITKAGLENELYVGSALVDMYGDCGSLAEACQVFEHLPIRCIGSWAAMIKAYGKNQKGIMSVKCFTEMQGHGLKPNPVTFLCLLAACGQCSLVVEAHKCFQLLRQDQGLYKFFDYHYACMADILARSGLIFEAERLIEALDRPPSSTVLHSLLSASKVYGEVKLGQKCFQQLIDTCQDKSSAFVLMSDIYASVNRWSEASRLEDLRKHAGVKKQPGSAFIEVNKNCHEFVVGVDVDVHTLDALESIGTRVKNEGFVPDINLFSKLLGNEQRGMLCMSPSTEFWCLVGHEGFRTKQT